MKRRAVIRFGQEKVKNITCHHRPVQTNHSELAVHFIDATGSEPCLTSPQQRPRVMITVGTWRLGHGRSKIWLFGHKKKKQKKNESWITMTTPRRAARSWSHLGRRQKAEIMTPPPAKIQRMETFLLTSGVTGA